MPCGPDVRCLSGTDRLASRVDQCATHRFTASASLVRAKMRLGRYSRKVPSAAGYACWRCTSCAAAHGDGHVLSFGDCGSRSLRVQPSRFYRAGRCHHPPDAQSLAKPHHPRPKLGELRSSEPARPTVRQWRPRWPLPTHARATSQRPVDKCRPSLRAAAVARRTRSTRKRASSPRRTPRWPRLSRRYDSLPPFHLGRVLINRPLCPKSGHSSAH